MQTKLPDLRWIAAAAFVVGVTLHACVALVVLGSGGSGGGGGSGSGVIVTPASQRAAGGAAATPTRLPDRTACAEIRGTDYRSDTERAWFLQNCAGTQAAPPLVTPQSNVDS